jgi:hypothetical protein
MLTVNGLWETAGQQKRGVIQEYFTEERFTKQPESHEFVMAVRYYVTAGYKLLLKTIDPDLPSPNDLWNLGFFLSFHRPFYRREGVNKADYPPVCAFLPFDC